MAGAPDGGRGALRYTAGVFVNAAGTGFFLAFTLLFYAVLARVELEVVGRVLALTAIAVLPGLLLVGRLTDRFGPRAVLVGAALVRGLTFWAFVRWPGVLAMIVCSALLSLGARAEQSAIPVLAVRAAPPGESGRWLALSRVAFNAGVGLGAVLAGFLATRQDSHAFAVLGVLTGAACVGGALCYLSLGVGGPPDPPAHPEGGPPAAAVARPWRHSAFLRVGIAYAVLWMVAFATENAMSVFVVRSLGLPSTVVGLLFAVNTLLLVILQVPASGLLDRFRPTRLLGYGSLGYVAFFGACLLAPQVGTSARVWVLVAGMAVYTLGEIAVTQSALVLLTSLAPASAQGSYLAFHQIIVGFTTALSPVLATALLVRGSWPLWVVLSTVTVGAAALAFQVGAAAGEGARPPSRAAAVDRSE